MAANYWASTQYRHWLFEREKLAEIRKSVEEKDKQLILQFPLPDLRLLSIYMNQQLIKLGKRMSTRQQALATAQVYIRRFYTKVEIRRTNPYLVLATAFYLACKMEECPHHIRYIVAEARGLWPDFIISDVSKFGEMEFWIISELNSQLIVHHPYRALSELQGPLSLSTEENSLAWSIINDHFLTDLPLLQPPHVIAVMGILIAVVFKPTPAGAGSAGSQSQAPSGGGGPPAHATGFRDGIAGALTALAGDKPATPGANGGGGLPPRISKIVDWLADGEVNIEAVIESTQELLSLYEIWGTYSEKTCKEQIGRYVKARSLDK